jgi:hypothetical protein
LTALGTADLTAMLGLITLADPIDIPEGASPRTFDTDYDVGSVFTRAGLQSIYTYGGGNTATEGPYFGTVATIFGLGVWDNPDYANADTVGEYATTDQPNAPNPSQWLRLTGYGFTIPTNDVISGIVVSFNAYVFGYHPNPAQPINVQLLKAGTPVGLAKQITADETVTNFSLGSPTDLWNTTWLYSDINNASFGVQLLPSPVVTSGGMLGINDVQITVTYLVAVGNNTFTYIKTYTQNTGQLFTFALASNGILWAEDVVSDPTVLDSVLTRLYAGSYGQSSTGDDQEYIMFSLPTQAVVADEPTLLYMGYDRPRVASETQTGAGVTGLQFTPHSQVGPGIAPSFSTIPASGAGAPYFEISSYAVVNNLVTVQYAPYRNSAPFPGLQPFPGQLLAIYNVSTPLNDIVVVVNSDSDATPLNATEFTFYYETPNASGASPMGTANSPYNVTFSELDQNWDSNNYHPEGNGFWQSEWQGITQSNTSITNNTPAPNMSTPLPGNVVTVYYGPLSTAHPDPNMDAFQTSAGAIPLYVQVAYSPTYGAPPFGIGSWQVTQTGFSMPTGDSHNWWFFAYDVGTTLYQQLKQSSTVTGAYWITRATLVTNTPMIGVQNGDSFLITHAEDANNGQYNGEWEVLTSNAYTLSIGSTELTGAGGHTLRINFSIEGGDISGDLPTPLASYTATGGSITITVGNPPCQFRDGEGVYIVGTGTALDGFVWTASIGWGIPNNEFNVYDPNVPDGAGDFPSTAYAIPINCIYGATGIEANGGGMYTLPILGQFVTISGSTNNNGAFNISGYITNTDGFGFMEVFFGPGGTFAEAPDTGQITVSGTIFIFDPGQKYVNIENGISFFGPYKGQGVGTGADAEVTVINNVTAPVSEGTRQGTVYFVTESGYTTAPAPPVQFTVPLNTFAVQANEIPVGPPNVTQRVIVITEAGQNGTPGGQFYTLETPTVITDSFTGQIITYSSFVIDDNTTRSAFFTFADSALQAGTAIDVQGNDLFNLVELGAAAWCVPYASRMFYGLQLNKVQNLVNMSFNGGTISTSAPLLPAGWINFTDGGAYPNDATLETDSTIDTIMPFETALYIKNSTGSTITTSSYFYQSAYQDVFNVNIIQPNTTYSIRAVLSIPSGDSAAGEAFVVQLVGIQDGVIGTVYGTATFDFTSLTTTRTTYISTLLTTPFTTMVPTDLKLSFHVENLHAGHDLCIYRLEVFPTQEPFITAQVYGSYIDNLEALDGSNTGGIIDTSGENPQPVMGGFVMHDKLWLLKTKSIYTVEDNPSSEPSGWGLFEVSNRVGCCGVHAFDAGEEWFVTACRPGIFGFAGGQPEKIMEEIFQIWEAINWFYGGSIVLRNDIKARKLYCAIPLPTPNQWLPYAPLNMNPTVPNVMLMCNYQGLGSFAELVSTASAGMHTTMFGTLAAVDMKRKWSIWQIPTPAMDFITRQDGLTEVLFICNSTATSKIYQLSDTQYSDDGAPINSLYTTYGFVNSAKATTVPILGMHQKRWTTMQFTAGGEGALQIRLAQNLLADYPATGEGAKYPWIIPGELQTSGLYASASLDGNAQDDYVRPINIHGVRCFIEFQTNAVDSYFDLHKVLLSGKADAWSPINPTGGGNVGVTGTQPS